MIDLQVQGFQWIKGPKDDPSDQCAHGRVSFAINKTRFVKPEDGVWTISASALYLLRTITEDHTPNNSVTEGNLLFPCCGFSVWLIGKRFKVMCMGCPNGIDVEILHQKNSVIISSIAGSETINQREWATAVLDFADSVRNFYRISSPKVIIDDDFDRQGWSGFWQEWDERYELAKSIISNSV